MVSVFLKFVGDSPSTRLWDFLLTGRDFDYSLTDLSENAGIGWSTLHRIFPEFEKQQIVIKTREIGRAKLYKLNLQNPRVKKMISLYHSLLEKQLNAFEEKQVMPIKALAR